MNLETRQIGEQFRILDPARVPERPFSPNRLRLNTAGALAGLVLGAAFVFLLEWRDTSLKTDDDVKIALSLPVLALVPFMQTRSASCAVTAVDAGRSRLAGVRASAS